MDSVFHGETLWYNVSSHTNINTKGFMMEITVRYQGHSGVNLGFTDTMEYLPRVGEMIENSYLRSHSCTGLFVIIEITHARDDNGKFSALVQCIEISDVDDKRVRLAEAGNIPHIP